MIKTVHDARVLFHLSELVLKDSVLIDYDINLFHLFSKLLVFSVSCMTPSPLPRVLAVS